MKRTTAVALSATAVLAGALTALALYGARLGPDTARLAAGTPLGDCSIHSPGEAPRGGAAAYDVGLGPLRSRQQGTMAVVIVCSTPGPLGDRLTLSLPYLASGEPIPPGSYPIYRPNARFTRAPGRIAWAHVARGAADSIPFIGAYGTVTIKQVGRGRVLGAYHVAFDYAGDLPTEHPELALAGAFDAPLVE